jgi:hypothetical protein
VSSHALTRHPAAATGCKYLQRLVPSILACVERGAHAGDRAASSRLAVSFHHRTAASSSSTVAPFPCSNHPRKTLAADVGMYGRWIPDFPSDTSAGSSAAVHGVSRWPMADSPTDVKPTVRQSRGQANYVHTPSCRRVHALGTVRYDNLESKLAYESQPTASKHDRILGSWLISP